jgi:hypothetical protein
MDTAEVERLDLKPLPCAASEVERVALNALSKPSPKSFNQRWGLSAPTGGWESVRFKLDEDIALRLCVFLSWRRCRSAD